MSPALLLALWTSAVSLLLSGVWLSHRHYTTLLTNDVRAFEAEWKNLEKTRDPLKP